MVAMTTTHLKQRLNVAVCTRLLNLSLAEHYIITLRTSSNLPTSLYTVLRLLCDVISENSFYFRYNCSSVSLNVTADNKSGTNCEMSSSGSMF